MGFGFDDIGRIGIGIATGGGSEIFRGDGVLNPSGSNFLGAGSLNRLDRAEELYGGVDPNNKMSQAADRMGRFGLHGRDEFMQGGKDLAAQRGQMQGLSDQFGRVGAQYGQQFGSIASGLGRIAQGKDSIAAEQLRQGLQQNQAAQMSMAAGASPQNQAMAARTAMNNMGRQGMGMSGQAAIAGLQERRDALAGQMGALGAGAQAQQGFMGGQAGLQGMIQQGMLGQRGQNAQVAMGGMQGELAGYGNIEDQRTRRYGAAAGTPTPAEQMTGLVASGLEAYAKGG